MAGFEAAVPLIGVALGAPLGRAIGSAADYLAVAVLLVFGMYTLLDRDEAEEVDARKLADVSGWSAVALGPSISLDELAIGFTLGLLRLPLVPVIVLIGAQAFVLSQLGLRLGTRLSARVREGAERVAGLVLIVLGIVLLTEKVTAG